jgi:hypothetical protein
MKALLLRTSVIVRVGRAFFLSPCSGASNLRERLSFQKFSSRDISSQNTELLVSKEIISSGRGINTSIALQLKLAIWSMMMTKLG